jgi:hypothetical protein
MTIMPVKQPIPYPAVFPYILAVIEFSPGNTGGILDTLKETAIDDT